MKRTHFKKLILLALTGIIWPIASPFSSAADEAAGMDFFEKNIRPVLVENCYKCHSSEAKKVKGGLKLDTRAVTLKGGDSGPAIIPGDPENSLMVKALRYTGEELRMPPDGKLPDEVVNHFVEWIKMGAPDPRGEDTPRPADASTTATLPKKTINYEEGRKFWSFRPPADHAPPQVKNAAWPANPLDQFILAKLEEKNLAPAPEAGKRTLIRRATFDLTGLPPTPDEIHAFLADHSPDAFAKVVDRLLASPQYGERWGRHWLDVVRYTDSVDSRATYEQDVSEAYRYRDWVVDAFNRDMPYGKFLMMQIAGDLMPPEKGEAGAGGEGFNREGLIATGMLAIGNWPGGDADKQKMVSDIVDDQLDVVTRGMMGVTVACSRCHDHKFDPFATEDYYGLAGIFFSSHILPGPGRKTEGSPLLHIPLLPAAELEARKKRETRMSDLRVQIQAIFNAENAEAAKRLLPHAAEYMVAAWDFRNASRSKFDLQIEPFAKDRGLDPAMLRRWISHLGLEDLRLFKKPMVKVGNIEGVNGF
ncbi:DUF1549 domain-containing protein, partial [Candidatus Sumerlaeota bacterium]|nr:DUF1549 domain-containing protein [Candidatus Sumerlaeota bacterium]